MPRKKSPPTYRLHKARNCAVVTINGHCHYLGPYGSPASHEKYARLIASWRAEPESPPRAEPCSASVDLSINELILRYWRHVEEYYRQGERPTGEQPTIRAALWHLRNLYGTTPAGEFGPQALKRVRQAMIDAGLSRRVINDYISRVRRMFRWAVENGGYCDCEVMLNTWMNWIDWAEEGLPEDDQDNEVPIVE